MKLLRKLSNAPYAVLAAATVAVLNPSTAYAQGSTVGDIATTVQEQVGSVGKLVVIGAFLGGVVLVAAGLMKLKQAADSQGQQVKYGDGLWRLAVGAGLVAVPALTGVLTSSLGLQAATVSASSGF